MARPRRCLAPGLLYHVTARGNRREPTFLTDADYEAYLVRLAVYRKRYGIGLYAYCLMPNHVHLLLQTSGSPLSKFMQGLQQSYTQHFNRVHEKVGHLFQGRYKAIVCDRDEYFVTLVRYIHLNPVRAGLVESPERYPYSGHRAYLAPGRSAGLDVGPVLGRLGGRDAYRAFVLAGVDDGHDGRYYRTEDQQFLGARPPAQEHGQDAQPVGVQLNEPLDVVVGELARSVALDPSALRSPDRGHAVSGARAVVAFVLVRRFGFRVADVARTLGRDATGVSVMLSRLEKRLESDRWLSATVHALTESVKNVRPDPVRAPAAPGPRR